MIITATEQSSTHYKETIVNQATDLIGSDSVRYLYEHPELGQSPDEGFDCSGFVRFVLTQSGLSVPDYFGSDLIQRPIRHVNEFWDHYGVSVHNDLFEPGDLIFFTNRNARGYFPNHIGIVRNGESYIHAPGKDGTKVGIAEITKEVVVPVKELGRVLYSHNPIGFKAHLAPIEDATYRRHQTVI